MRKRAKDIRSGLVLLIVLGMVAMFSLLAVTYVVTAGASRDGSRDILKAARQQNFSIGGFANMVRTGIIAGTNDVQSPFYSKSLLGDIFGQHPVETTAFTHIDENGGVHGVSPLFSANINAAYSSPHLPATAFVRLPLNPNTADGLGLSPYENEYNGRILTFLEGPLTGQSFRILKYIGYVRPVTGTSLPRVADPNVETTPWTQQLYEDPTAPQIAYSVLLDLREIRGEKFLGAYYPNGSSETKSARLSLIEWIKWQGLESLFYQPRPNGAGPFLGFNVLINDAAFNSPGIGVEEVNQVPDPNNPMGAPINVAGFGNVDGRRMMAIPSAFKVSPALLTDYDYISTPGIMAVNPFNGRVGVEQIGSRRASGDRLSFNMGGWSNEGYDVPGYQDPWLAYQSWMPNHFYVKPSYHDPAVIQYLAHLFGNPDSLSEAQVTELLRLIDTASSRVMSYLTVNPQFMSNKPNYPRLTSLSWSSPPTMAEIAEVRNYVRSQILGPWDVDNDGDGTADSVWIDPNLPVVYSPDGRRLKPLAAILITDLDSRVNINTAGDRIEALNPAFPSVPGRTTGPQGTLQGAFKSTSPYLIPSGFGFGAAEISLSRFFARDLGSLTNSTGRVNQLLKSTPNRYSFFDERYGVRRSPFYGRNPINFVAPSVDRTPGLRGFDDVASIFNQRETFTSPASLPGISISRRGGMGLTQDAMGNPIMIFPADLDVNPLNPSSVAIADETLDDAYESSASGRPISDDPVSLVELEAILRRFDGDAEALPQRMRNYMKQAGFADINDFIYSQVTTKSGELRYPNIAAARLRANGAAREIDHHSLSMSQYVRWLHDQRYRHRSFPAAPTDDPELSNAAISDLFSADFSSLLRLDVNRPLGDGIDSNGNFMVDDPLELATSGESGGYFTREIQLTARKPGTTVGGSNTPSETRLRLGSRQILARNLYCLAQLIVPKEHDFPGMETLPVSTANVWPRAQLRARYLAQWAINVVDFRDADGAMSRFEYDILPFGIGIAQASGSGGVITARPAYWAPDRIFETVNGTDNKTYVGVVWGMEMPELALSETFAIHDKRVKDTNLDPTNNLVSGGDPHFDQFRFPQASLFIELVNVRSTSPSSGVAPGVPRGNLYSFDSAGNLALNLGAMAPPAATWGAQPVWRIAISEDHGINGVANPNTPDGMLAGASSPMRWITNQFSFTTQGTGTARDGLPAGQATTIEQYIGNKLVYNPLAPAVLEPGSPPNPGFERFVWFTPNGPTAGQPVPDLNSTAPGHAVASVYHMATHFDSNLTNMDVNLLRGGEYLVVAPRDTTPIGSLTHNPVTGAAYPAAIDSATLSSIAPINRYRHAPSYQHISLIPLGSGAPGASATPFAYPRTAGPLTLRTFGLNGAPRNGLWRLNSKPPKAMICTVPAPDNPAVPPASDWASCFPDGVGLNISYPTPIFNAAATSYWNAGHRPGVRLNSLDVRTSSPARPGDSLGFGDASLATGEYMPPDSYVDLSAGTPAANFPDAPFDLTNPYVGGLGRYPTGTYENVRTAYLQRLADPEFPYDPFSNPYITVDWMPIDLTVFNGEAPAGTDPLDSIPMTSPNIHLTSRYKNGTYTPSVSASPSLPATGNTLHSPITTAPRVSVAQAPPPPASPIIYESYVSHMLGYDLPVDWTLDQASGFTLGYANAGFHTGGSLLELNAATTANLDGFGVPTPNTEFAYQGVTQNLQGVAWYNRPYASPLELALVPATGPGNFGLYHSGFTGNERNPFAFLPSFQASNAWNVDYPTDHSASYWAIPVPVSTGTGSKLEADWPLMLEYLETKPPFANAHRIVDPTHIATLATSNPVANRTLNSYIPPGYYYENPGLPTAIAVADPDTVRGPTLLGPFNRVPSYVTEGKVNLNTVSFDSSGRSRTLEAIEQHYLRGANVALPFRNSRAGYDTTNPGVNAFFQAVVGHFNPNLPTDFAGAFRPGMSSNLAPPAATPTATAIMRSRSSLQATLMRAADLAAHNTTTLSASPNVFNSTASAQPAETINGQAFARMQRLMRLPNLVTGQSNNFAVWVTVSLFEYDPINEFGNEYIAPNGQPIRDRRFYIIDRTTPVGFKPGEKLNTDKVILLEKQL